MKDKDLFNAINDINLKYVEESWGNTEEKVGETVAPVIVRPAKRSPMRFFRGAAACVGVVGAAAAAVIIISGLGNIKTLPPVKSDIENSQAYTGSFESAENTDENGSGAVWDYELTGTSADVLLWEGNWKKLKEGSEGISDADPLKAVEKELEQFSKNNCSSFELHSIDYDSTKPYINDSYFAETYGIKNKNRITVVFADFYAKLTNDMWGYSEIYGNQYCLIQDGSGIWHTFSYYCHDDGYAAQNEENAVWLKLKEEQKNISASEAVITVQNFLRAKYDDTLVIDRIRYSDREFSIDNKAAADYGFILDTNGRIIGEHHGCVIEAVYHTTTEDGKTVSRIELFTPISANNGYWYIAEDIQSRLGSPSEIKRYTVDEAWEKARDQTLYPSADPFETVNKELENYLNGDGILSAVIKAVYLDEERTQKQRSGDYGDAYLYQYLIKDLNRVEVITVTLNAELDPEKNYGRDSSEGLVYILVQDTDGVWYIKEWCDISGYPQ